MRDRGWRCRSARRSRSSCPGRAARPRRRRRASSRRRTRRRCGSGCRARRPAARAARRAPPRRPRAGSEAPLVSHIVTFSAPASSGRLQAARSRTPGRRGSRRRSARRRRSRACPGATRKATDSAIIARFSSRSTLTTFSRCRPQVLPTSVQTGANDSASTRSAASSSARHAAPARHPERAHVGAQALVARAARRARASFGFEAGKPASIIGHAEVVEDVRDAHLLLRPTATCPRPASRRAGCVS